MLAWILLGLLLVGIVAAVRVVQPREDDFLHLPRSRRRDRDLTISRR